MKTTSSLREYGHLTHEDDLTEAQATRLHILAERSARRMKLPETAVLTRTSKGVKAGQVVGLLSVPGITLEILPKIDGDDGAVRKALIHMLAVAWNLRIAHGEIANLDTQRNDLLELLIGLFAEHLLGAIRRGLPRRYLAREEDLALLRGSLDIKRQFTYLAARPDQLACRFEELSENTPLNRVLKAAVALLAGHVRSAANARRLAELAARLEFVGDSSEPLREPVRLDRSNTAFHNLYRFARLFLEGNWQSTAAGSKDGFALLFPMNDLFEKFIGESLKKAVSHRAVKLQYWKGYAITTVTGDGQNEGKLFAMCPDIVVEPESSPIVLDTKWKRVDPDDTKLGISPSDIYQMLAYGQAYNAERLVLIYPWHEQKNLREGIIRNWKVTESDRLFDIATVNVGQPDTVQDTLRHIVESTQTNLAAT